LLLATLQAPPRFGSLREWVLILTLHRLEDVEHAKFRALAQVTLDKDQGVKAFEDYMKIAFPYLEGRKKAQKDEAKGALKKWISEGAFKITPVVQNNIRSKLKTRVLARQASKEDSQLYQRVASKKRIT
jgi:hypothetical protein